jgi:hypothetical protein
MFWCIGFLKKEPQGYSNVEMKLIYGYVFKEEIVIKLDQVYFRKQWVMNIKNQKRKGFIFRMVLFFIGVGVLTCIAETCPASFVNMGTINIKGSLRDTYVVCFPVNNNTVIVSPQGENVTIQVKYMMNCSRMFDDGYCNISFVDGGGASSINTSGIDSGYLTISKFMMPGESFTVKLYALYSDTYSGQKLGEDTQYAYGAVIARQQPKSVPGFEFIILFVAISFLLIWKRKR